MDSLVTIFSLLAGIAGWYYMFYSRAAVQLESIECQRVNQKRQRLRRVGGFLMLLLGVGFYAGFRAVDPQVSARAFVLVWAMVFALLLGIMLLAMIDLMLTRRLGRARRESQESRQDQAP